MQNCAYYFFEDIINIKKFDLNDIKMDEKSYEDVFIYYTGYVIVKEWEYVKINSVNPLFLAK